MRYIYCLILLFISSLSSAQNSDLFPEVKLFSKVYAKFALDDKPSLLADTNLIAIWKMNEDPDMHNFFVMERYAPNQFVFTYMNRGGSNRTYENVGAFFSEVAGFKFLNVRYRNHSTDEMGYFFLKVTDLDSRGWDMTLSLVKDSTLKNITSQKALRERIYQNVNNPEYFGNPIHLEKKLPLMYCK
jgi:hypothetical protein